MLIKCGNCFEQYEYEYELCPHCGYVQGEPAKELYHLYPGMILNDRYVVGQVLGFGGFGITYKVWDKHLDTILAIKEYYPSGLVNRTPGTKKVSLFAKNRQREYAHGLMRFLDEARNMAKFNSHKSIINVFEYFEENDTAYIVMEYLDGLTLNDFLKNNRLDAETSVSLIYHVCDALKDIHAAGIIHRDVSPDNIFICTNNAIKLIDFGAARFSANEETLMTIILKPGFAPPEQYEKINIQGPWTDIYALGATLYYMVTGVKPEESTNRKIADTLVPPMELNNAIPENISNTIMKAMAIDKHLRFISIVEFEKALSGNKRVLPVSKEKKRRKRRRFATVLTSALVIIISASIFLINWNRNLEQETLPDADISMWYSLSGEDEDDAAKNDSYAAIVAAFNNSFPNVTIEIITYLREDYAVKLQAAISNGIMPTLFESTGMSNNILENSIDLSGVLKSVGDEQCYFLDNYLTYFPQKNQMPLGFVAPVIYLNTTFSGSEAANSANSTNSANSANYKEAFLSGEAERYISDTSDYFDVQKALPARYKLLRVDSDSVLGLFDDLWSIGKCGVNEKKAAERLLLFMLSDNAQDYLHIRNRSASLPINRDALDVFCDVYNDFDGFFVNIENYYFEIQR